MKFLVTVRMPVEGGNTFVKNPSFGERIQEILASQKAESVYFGASQGQRTGYYVVDLQDAAKLPSIAEPWWLLTKADVECIPVMTPQDLTKAAPDIVNCVKKYGTT